MVVRRPIVLNAGVSQELGDSDCIPRLLDPLGVMIETDFFSVNAVQGEFISAAISSGTNINNPTAAMITAHHPGIQLWRSSTTANSGYNCLTERISNRIFGGEIWGIFFGTPTSISGTTTIRSGGLDSSGATAPVDGAFFEINGTTLAGKTRSNSTESVTASTFTLSTSTWYHGRIEVNSGGTVITFTLYSEAGTSLWTDTLTTNIPTASGREFGWGTVATNSGTTAVDLVLMDKMILRIKRVLQRGAS